MYVKCFSAHICGIDGQIIEVEVDIASGLPSFEIVGLPGSALKEAKERVRSAIKNSGNAFPNRRITVNLAPAHIRKEGSFFDLPIALAILLADKQIYFSSSTQDLLAETLLIGELALDGKVRKSAGVLPLVIAAQEMGFKRMIIPQDNLPEACVIEQVHTLGISHLKFLIRDLEDGSLFEQEINKPAIKIEMKKEADKELANGEGADFKDIRGQEHVKRAFEIAACGYHHLLLTGPPGSGKTLLAKSFVSLLPDLSTAEAIEVTKVYSVAGLLQPKEGLIRKRPFRQPHHSITGPGMLGGGISIKPGEISLAHHGVLFLDEFLEFKKEVIESLREPLQEGKVTISRSQQSYILPSRFLLICAFNPCPCGYYGYESSQKSCTCTASQIHHYQHKLSGPIYDRLDIHLQVPPLPAEELLMNNPAPDPFYTTANMVSRIEAGLAFQAERKASLKRTGKLSHQEMIDECKLTKEAGDLLRLVFENLTLSARSYHKILSIGRTIADLKQAELIDEEAIAEAIQFRSLDR